MRGNYVDPDEIKWQRRSDARTLAEAEQIKSDKSRYAGAQIGAKEILDEETARLNGLSKVAGKKVVDNSSSPSKKNQMMNMNGNMNNNMPAFPVRPVF